MITFVIGFLSGSFFVIGIEFATIELAARLREFLKVIK